MKIMLVCAGGMSTGLLMNKLNKDETLDVKAYGFAEYQEHMSEFDVILLGPQVSYKESEIKAQASIPVAVIPALDYAVGDTDKIVSLAKGLI